jgi:hypothetical protein
MIVVETLGPVAGEMAITEDFGVQLHGHNLLSNSSWILFRIWQAFGGNSWYSNEKCPLVESEMTLFASVPFL